VLQHPEHAILNASPSPPATHVLRRSFTRVARFDASLPADLVDALWANPAALVARGKPLQCKAVRQTVQIDWQGQPYVLKQYAEPSWRHALKRSMQTARARLTWEFTHRLADAGIATPRPVACVENRFGPFGRHSFLVYPYIEGRTLRSCFAGEAKKSRSLHDRLWQQVNDVWQHLVELRVSLGDTNLGNFIVCPAGRLWLIDLDKSRFHSAAETAAPHQARAWQQLLRSAAKC
jgi:tRNA A-37 threonylcarbamoyl transferase component Bud32